MGHLMRRASVALMAVITAAAGSVVVTAPAQAAGSLWTEIGHCIYPIPSTYHRAPYLAGDLVQVWSPPSYATRADALAHELRVKGVASRYVSRLGITSLGAPGQPQPFPVVLDPYLHLTLTGTAGVVGELCANHARDAALIDPAAVSSTDELYEGAAHELFHAAQDAIDSSQSSNWLIESTAEWAAARFGYTTPSSYVPYVTSRPDRPIDAFDNSGEGASHQYGAWVFIDWLFTRGDLSWSGLQTLFQQTNHVSDHTALLKSHVGTLRFNDDVASFWGDRVRIHPQGEGPAGKLSPIAVPSGSSTRTIATAATYAANLISLRPPTTTGIMQVHIHTLGTGVQGYVNQGHDALAHVAGGDDYTETFCFGGSAKGTIAMPKGASVRLALATTNSSQAPAVQIDTVVSAQQCPQDTVIVPGIAVGPLHLGMSRAQAKAAALEFTYKAHPTTPCPTCIWAGYKTSGQRVIGAIYSRGTISTLYVIGQVGFITTAGVSPSWYLSMISPDVAFPEPVGSSMSELKHAAAVACAPLSGGKHPALNCRQQQPSGRYTTYQMGWISCIKADLEMCRNPDNLPIGPEAGYYVQNIIVSKYKQWGIYG